MISYLLRVNYGESETVDVPLECAPDDAETHRQALVSRIERAHQLEVPEIGAADDGAAAQIAIDPARVTSVDLVDVWRVLIRPRQPADLPALLTILQRTHEQEGYPVRASAVRADWIAAPEELDGAVAAREDTVVGHVALHRPATPGHDPGEDEASRQWQQATGVGADGLAVVSRLFTDRSEPGIGTALLAHAVDVAAQLGRVAVLLVDPDAPARAFYLRRGWTEIGSARQVWGHRTVDAALMVRPPASA